MRSLLVPVQNHPHNETKLELASRVGKQFNAIVEGIYHFTTTSAYVPVDLAGSSKWMGDQLTTNDDIQESKRIFCKAMEKTGLAHTSQDSLTAPTEGSYLWIDSLTPGDTFLSYYARIFSMTILNRPGENDPSNHQALVETILVESGRPLLLSPPDELPKTLFENVLIVWYPAPETSRAVALAEPILKQAKTIHVVADGSTNDVRPTINEVARSLKREGFETHHHLIHPPKKFNGDAVVELSNTLGCDLIIKGAYTQNRLRQMVFGSITSHLLAHCPVPLFLAH